MPNDKIGLKYGFRSGLESKFASRLDKLKVKYTYEDNKINFIQPEKKRSYTPDFMIGDLVIETKGRFVTADRQKHLLIKEQHPELDIRFIFSNKRAKIRKGSKTTYEMWCDKNGFICCDFKEETVWKRWFSKRRGKGGKNGN